MVGRGGIHPHPPTAECISRILTRLAAQLVSRCAAAPHPFEKSTAALPFARRCRALHARSLLLGLRLSDRLGHAIVDLYAKSGDLRSALQAFTRLQAPSKASSGALLSGHARWGAAADVLRAFQFLRCNGSPVDQHGLAAVLSACGKSCALDVGMQVHSEVLKSGFGESAFCEASLVDMYAKCGRVVDAGRVFSAIREPDVIIWTNMIAGYLKVELCEEALNLFTSMVAMGITPDQFVCVTVMSACVQLGRLDHARAVFREINCPSEVAWSAIISAHAQNGDEGVALGFFREMRSKGVQSTRSILGSVLSVISSLGACDKGMQIHSEAMKLGLDSNVFVGSSLVNMYAKCGHINDAQRVFSHCSAKNIVMWNAMFAGFGQNGWPAQTIELFAEAVLTKIKPDEVTIISVLGACASLENIDLGKQLHTVVIKCGFCSNLSVVNVLVSMYAKCGDVDEAKKQFRFIRTKDIVSWNTIIGGLVQNKMDQEALLMLKQMTSAAIFLDNTSFASGLSACASMPSSETGKQIHGLSIKYNLISNPYVGSALVDFYSKNLDPKAAKKAFLQIKERSLVPYNALIAGLVHNGDESGAIVAFRKMLEDDLSPSDLTFTSFIPALTGTNRLVLGLQAHCYIVKCGMLNTDNFLGVSLLSMYLKFKMVEDSNKIFMEVPDKNSLVLWTAIISGHAQIGYSVEALVLFWKMRSCYIYSDEVTFASVLKACSELACLQHGMEIHGLIVKSGFSSHAVAVCALIDMYSKCGEIWMSLKAFEEHEKKDDITLWNSLIVGFAKNGYAPEALSMYQSMHEALIKPDDVTFLGVLIACVHARLVCQGRQIFDSMKRIYGITPRADHYACLIDLLGRAGHLKEAEQLIRELPFEPDSIILSTYLSACVMHMDRDRGAIAAEKLIEIGSDEPSIYVLRANLHASSGWWSEAKMVREEMKEKGVRKLPGCSWITVESETNVS